MCIMIVTQTNALFKTLFSFVNIFDIILLLKLESLRDVDGSLLEKKVQLNLFSHIYEKKHSM